MVTLHPASLMIRGCPLGLLREKVKEAAEGRSPVGRASPTFSTIIQSAEPPFKLAGRHPASAGPRALWFKRPLHLYNACDPKVKCLPGERESAHIAELGIRSVL